jgi:hypothetical protein
MPRDDTHLSLRPAEKPTVQKDRLLVQRTDTLPAEDPSWHLPKPVAGRAPILPRNEPVVYLRSSCYRDDDAADVEEE